MSVAETYLIEMREGSSRATSRTLRCVRGRENNPFYAVLVSFGWCYDLIYYTGADFIKTSTGKENVNAILPVGLVMVRAIREYYSRTSVKVSSRHISHSIIYNYSYPITLINSPYLNYSPPPLSPWADILFLASSQPRWMCSFLANTTNPCHLQNCFTKSF